MGLLEIGYHLVIDREGFVHRIRDVLSVGSHCPAYNHISVGVCLIGGLDVEGNPASNFTGVQLRVLHDLIAGFMRQWPHASVKGHNELAGYMVDRCKCPALDMDAVRSWVIDAKGQLLTEMVAQGVPADAPVHNDE